MQIGLDFGSSAGRVPAREKWLAPKGRGCTELVSRGVRAGLDRRHGCSDIGGWHCGGVVNGGSSGVRVVTREQLTSAGLSSEKVRWLLRQGRLVTVRRGVYATADPASQEDRQQEHLLQVAAAIAASGARATGSHQSAALLHGLDLIGKQAGDLVHLTRAARGRGGHSGRAGTRIHLAEIPATHLTVMRGVPVTSVARTVVDLARVGSFAEGVVVADSALRTGKVTVAGIKAVIAECERWPGVRRARRAIEFSDGRAESALESIGRAVFHEHGLPPPELQVWVGTDDLGVVGRADYLWRKYRTVAEADGAVKYANPGRAISQLNRDARLRDAGFEVVHFTWQEITMAPRQVVDRIRVAFARSGSG